MPVRRDRAFIRNFLHKHPRSGHHCIGPRTCYSSGMFEHKSEPVVSSHLFVRRMVLCFGLALCVVMVALGIGIAGYRFTAHLTWLDSLLNAAMILSGMGPVDRLEIPAAKWFAACYAIFSGLVFISVMGIILAPVIHRILHKFHLDERDEETL